ncbi:MAG: response regulator [Oscillospiraceae bacterium]|nr:response regulator [Oscillospiraceae bacterium]
MKTIFIVDDSRTNLMMAEQALSDRYNIVTQLSASIMFEALENSIPDLILLDIMMPEINGFEALERLKADPRYADIPVIFITGNRNALIEARGYELGAADVIYKPFTNSSIHSCIEMQLRRCKQND